MKPGYHDNLRHDLLGFLPQKASLCIELGCGAGEFGAAIKSRLGAKIVGLELDPDAAQKAGLVLDQVWQGKLEDLADRLPWETCDLVVCNDILEHIADPGAVLDLISQRIRQPVHLLFSVPNVRYIEVLGQLALLGRWDYKSHGVLDRTHLRFFTRSSFRKLLSENGGTIIIEGFTSSCKNLPFRILDTLLFHSLKEFRYMQYAGLARITPKYHVLDRDKN